MFIQAVAPHYRGCRSHFLDHFQSFLVESNYHFLGDVSRWIELSTDWSPKQKLIFQSPNFNGNQVVVEPLTSKSSKHMQMNICIHIDSKIFILIKLCRLQMIGMKVKHVCNHCQYRKKR